MPARLTSAALASLVPWIAFLVATLIADQSVDYKSTSFTGLIETAPLSLAFVALPSFLPLAIARSQGTRTAALVVMAGVAAVAAVLVMTTDDAQAGLAILWVPFVAVPMAAVLWIGGAVASRRRESGHRMNDGALPPVALSDRLAALAIDVAIIGAVLIAPIMAMSHARLELAAGVVGIGVAALYLGGLTSAYGGTIGQSLLRLAVVDSSTGGRVPFPRSLARGFVVAVEIAGSPTVFLLPVAFAELLAASSSGLSLTDRWLRTRVVATR